MVARDSNHNPKRAADVSDINNAMRDVPSKAEGQRQKALWAGRRRGKMHYWVWMLMLEPGDGRRRQRQRRRANVGDDGWKRGRLGGE